MNGVNDEQKGLGEPYGLIWQGNRLRFANRRFNGTGMNIWLRKSGGLALMMTGMVLTTAAEPASIGKMPVIHNKASS